VSACASKPLRRYRLPRSRVLAALLVTGRVVGLVASFAIGIVLARIFAPATFGTYKQFFLLYGTLYGLAQLGMAESLYYFVPRNTSRTPRYVCNALITLAVAGLACLAALYLWRTQIAQRLTNTALADYMGLAGLFSDVHADVHGARGS
jgi:O-antigen/teichoic acid export membrane protein